MRKKILIVLSLIFVLSLSFVFTGCLGIKSPNPNKKIDTSSMKLILEENFDGENINENLWTCHNENRRGGWWDENQVKQNNGNLTITTEYKENGQFGAGWYTGSLLTKDKFTMKKGYAEARLKLPKGQGLWGAFWLSSRDMVAGKNGAEIDVVEGPYYDDPYSNKNWKNTAFHTLHINGYGDEHKSKQSHYYKVENDIYETFNTYGVYFDENQYIFYVNGMETWRTNFGTTTAPEYLWLSVEISGKMGTGDPSNPKNKYTWAGEITNNKEGKNFKSEFVIDYVKCWQ